MQRKHENDYDIIYELLRNQIDQNSLLGTSRGSMISNRESISSN